jgi:hypothetical protein
MPSIQDVADQVNAKFDQVVQNTANTVAIGNEIHSDLSQVNSKLDTLNSMLSSGVSEISNGLLAIWELQKVTNTILSNQSKHNAMIICLLENSNELLCGITRKLTRQLDLNEQLLKSLKRLEGITERVDSEAAGDFDRHAELQCQILECCPSSEPEPEPCPKACIPPKLEDYKPEGQDWKPSSRELIY